MIYVIIFLSLLAIPPARFRRLVWPAACCIGVVMFGLFGWAIASNGGKVGHLIPPAVKLTSTTRSFVMLYAITSAAGSATGYGSRMSDWTRFARTRNTPVWPMLLGPPLLSNITAILGILATSAVYTRFHVVLWNPLALLIYLQKYHYSPACRAATFFAGLALFYSLLMVSWRLIGEGVLSSLVSLTLPASSEQPHGKDCSRRDGLCGAVAQVHHHPSRRHCLDHHRGSCPAVEILVRSVDLFGRPQFVWRYENHHRSQRDHVLTVCSLRGARHRHHGRGLLDRAPAKVEDHGHL